MTAKRALQTGALCITTGFAEITLETVGFEEITFVVTLHTHKNGLAI